MAFSKNSYAHQSDDPEEALMSLINRYITKILCRHLGKNIYIRMSLNCSWGKLSKQSYSKKKFDFSWLNNRQSFEAVSITNKDKIGSLAYPQNRWYRSVRATYRIHDDIYEVFDTQRDRWQHTTGAMRPQSHKQGVNIHRTSQSH